MTAIDRRADLFSVGVMLWEMLAGRRMWQGMTEVDIVAHLAANRPLPALPSDANLPAGLDAICARALEIDPNRRYQTAVEMEMDLERVLIGSADSHARNLGKVVSMAFAADKAERQALIERHIRRSNPVMAAVVAPAVAPQGTPIPTSRQESGGIEITLSGLDHRDRIEPHHHLRMPAARPAPSSGVLWFRRVATVAGLAAAGAVIMIADGAWRRPSLRRPRRPGSHRDPAGAPAGAESRNRASSVDPRAGPQARARPQIRASTRPGRATGSGKCPPTRRLAPHAPPSSRP